MACFHPLEAWQLETGEVVFAERGKVRRSLTLPCGQCIGCRLERSRQNAVRCVHESKLHKRNCFITLTYDDDHVGYSLNYVDFQKFIRSLRKRTGLPIRYYMCGEYGDNFLRPHFHAILFGFDFEADQVVFSCRDGFNTYTSNFLSSVWTKGFSLIGDFSFETAAYVARYCMKKVTGPRAEAHYLRCVEATGELVQVVPEFSRMSLKPGLGAGFYEKFKSDIYPRDYVVINGVKASVPRYYKKLLALDDPELVEYLEFRRYDAVTDEQIRDRYSDRLEVRETVVRARLNQYRRNLE